MEHPDYARLGSEEFTEEDYIVIEGRACFVGNHSASCPRCIDWENVVLVIEGRACFPWARNARIDPAFKNLDPDLSTPEG